MDYGAHPASGQPEVNFVVTNQPVANNTIVVMQNNPVLRDWSSGLCSCFSDLEVCCCVLFCGECYEIHLALQMDESCCVGMCTPCSLIPLRTKLRTQHNIRGSIMDDTCARCCYTRLTMCQMGREIKYVRQQAMKEQGRGFTIISQK